jgi:hypothetical protein
MTKNSTAAAEDFVNAQNERLREKIRKIGERVNVKDTKFDTSFIREMYEEKKPKTSIWKSIKHSAEYGWKLGSAKGEEIATLFQDFQDDRLLTKHLKSKLKDIRKTDKDLYEALPAIFEVMEGLTPEEIHDALVDIHSMSKGPTKKENKK